MNEGNRKTALVIGAVAAAAGVAIASYVLTARSRSREEQSPPLRNVKEILHDCYVKMREIEAVLADLNATQPPPAEST